LFLEDEEEVVDNGRNDNRSCGVAAISPSVGTKLKIFGGRASSAGRWPWQVGHFFGIPDQFQFIMFDIGAGKVLL
jgi:hypothetical protein